MSHSALFSASVQNLFLPRWLLQIYLNIWYIINVVGSIHFSKILVKCRISEVVKIGVTDHYFPLFSLRQASLLNSPFTMFTIFSYCSIIFYVNVFFYQDCICGLTKFLSSYFFLQTVQLFLQRRSEHSLGLCVGVPENL